MYSSNLRQTEPFSWAWMQFCSFTSEPGSAWIMLDVYDTILSRSIRFSRDALACAFADIPDNVSDVYIFFPGYGLSLWSEIAWVSFWTFEFLEEAYGHVCGQQGNQWLMISFANDFFPHDAITWSCKCPNKSQAFFVDLTVSWFCRCQCSRNIW